MLRAVFGAPPAPNLGIGDDAAVIHGDRALVATVDASVEGVHFTRALLQLDEIAARACEAAMSDVAAMGAELACDGAGLLLAWSLPDEVDDDGLLALATGAQRAAARVGARVLGGNLSRGRELNLVTTALGRCAGAPVRRDGARPGEVVALSGPTGLAALGLRALLGGDHSPQWADAVARWRSPKARLDLSPSLVDRATSCIDLSDGLSIDAARLAEASGVSLILDASALRGAHPGSSQDEVESILHGGEDYELLATGPRDSFDDRWIIVGSVASGAGVYLRDGAEVSPITPRGWDHFSET